MIIGAFMFLYSVIVTVVCVLLLKKSFKSDETIDDLTESYVMMDEQIDSSLEIIDEHYGNIVRLANTPLMSDEPEIKELMSNLKHIKSAVLDVANTLNTLGHANANKEDAKQT